MSKPVAWSFVGLLIAALFGTACTPGSIIARQLTVAPNQQPKWLTEPGRWMPPAKVTLTYNAPSPERLISLQRATVGDPPASYRFGLIQPGHYGFQASGHWETNGNRPVFRFEMHLPSTAAPPPKPIPTPRGTVFLCTATGCPSTFCFPGASPSPKPAGAASWWIFADTAIRVATPSPSAFAKPWILNNY